MPRSPSGPSPRAVFLGAYLALALLQGVQAWLGSSAAGLPFAFVRKPGYRGHEPDEPPVRGADVEGRRVLLVDDAESSGASVEAFSAELASVGADVVGVYVLVAPEPDRQQPHEWDEIYVVLEGSGVLDVAGEANRLEEGGAVFVRAGAEHRFSAYEHLSVLVLFDKSQN